MSSPSGRCFPFPSPTSMYWETCHVTYDQAVEMFYSQTATQQAMGKNPLVSSTKVNRTKYSSFLDAQKSYSKKTIEHSLKCEEELLNHKDMGSKCAESLVNIINNTNRPISIEGDNNEVKKVGDDASAKDMQGSGKGFNGHFVLRDKRSNMNASNFAYKINTSKDSIEGKTGNDGKTQLVSSDQEDVLELEYVFQIRVGIE